MAWYRAYGVCILGFLVCGLGSVSGHYRSKGSELEPPSREEVLKTDGGMIEVWSSAFEQIPDMKIGAAFITLESGGLALPKYTDTSDVFYVVEGCAKIGLYYPWGFPTNTRTVTAGDIVVIPRGWVSWWWNVGKDKLRMFGVADTTASQGLYRSFHLMGAEEEHVGGILHGFSSDVLSRAWDVSEDVVKKLMEAQKGTAIIQTEKSGVNIPGEKASSNGAPTVADFRYNIDKADPDYEVEDGGDLTVLTCGKLPVLEKLGFGITRGRLEPGAIFAPHWYANAHVVAYITRGKGRTQIASPDGRNALDKDLEEGDLIIIPRFYPIVTLADEKSGLEWIAVATNSAPKASFLAGKLSLFNQFPGHVRRAAFNIDKDLDEKMYDSRRGEAVIFPPRKEGRKPSAAKFAETLRAYMGEIKDMF